MRPCSEPQRKALGGYGPPSLTRDLIDRSLYRPRVTCADFVERYVQPPLLQRLCCVYHIPSIALVVTARHWLVADYRGNIFSFIALLQAVLGNMKVGRRRARLH